MQNIETSNFRSRQREEADRAHVAGSPPPNLGGYNRSLRPGLVRGLTVLLLACLVFGALANPHGLTVQNGAASVAVNGSQFNVTASHNAFLNWQSFNIAAGETTRFVQPSASSVVWNRINDHNPSQIYGNLEANGMVVLMNQSGFYFGPNAFVKAAGLVVSTGSGTPLEFGGGAFWQFNGLPPQASIINNGLITTTPGGSVFFIAERIENKGSIITPEGSIGLVAGKSVLISDRPDGRGLSAQVNLPSGSVDNTGRLLADAGTIALHAQVVNQNGLVQANSVRERNGIIELVAADSITLGSDSLLQANGDATAVSAGGEGVIKSAGTFADVTGSRLEVAGGGQGGAGGFVEVSAPVMTAIKSEIDGHANAGSAGGRLLIDPQDIVIGYGGSDSAGEGTVDSGSPPAVGALYLDVSSAFIGFSQIALQATRDITLAAFTAWNLVESTGLAEPGSLLKLEAGNDIVLETGSSILAGPNWSVTLQAGRNFAAPDTVTAGVGEIRFDGNASLEARNGNINLLAGQNVIVGSGFVRTIAAVNITVEAKSGDVNAGENPNGFVFRTTGYGVSPNLGGISTANGGNVSLTAGHDIISYLPVGVGLHTDGGSGAFGSSPGNVTLIAGNDVYGHYVVRNGVGTIIAGRDAGKRGPRLDVAPGNQEPEQLLALSLAKGGWNVQANGLIFLQEVRNSSGTFNDRGFAGSTTKHLFDYSSDAYTILKAGGGVQLLGTSLPRNDGESTLPSIYPGRLEITTETGDVVLGNDVTLFPSPVGNLLITVKAGSLLGRKSGGLTQLLVSDSGRKQYLATTDFSIADHASTPVHLNNFDPVRLDIAGDMNAILLGVPKLAEITVGGDMINSRFDGQNLHAADVTSMTVGGDVRNRNEFTSVHTTTPPNFGLLEIAYPPLIGELGGLATMFYYNAATGLLTVQGRLSGNQLDALKNLRVRVFDAYGVPVLDASGEPVTQAAQFADAAALQALYEASQDVPANPDTGYRIGGGGSFNFTARNLDLGATAGIVAQGPRANAALAKYFTRGADINVNLAGNLDMFSTAITTPNGGNIRIVADGAVNAGTAGDFKPNEAVARGIFTVGNSDVTVIARGNVNVNGSRIAAYDGGNVTVRSLEGNVNAGTGGRGSAPVEKIYVDPNTRQILSYTPTIPGSGILATSFPPPFKGQDFPQSVNPVGNILVETPRGDIIASAGGIVQLPLNGVNNSQATVTLIAGTRDAEGNVVYVGNIDASGSGVIGSTVKLEASGSIKGLIFARNNINITASQSVNVTALAQGSVNVSSGGSVSGTIIGVGSVSASGTSVDAALLSQNVSASGNVSSSQIGFSQGTAAGTTSQSQQSDAPVKAVASATTSTDDDETRKRGGPRLTKTTGRVTVILPPKTN